MKFDRLKIKNFLCIRELEEELGPVVAVLGPNYSGKSTIAQALRFLFMGDTDRVRLKGDYGELITEGQKRGLVAATMGDRTIKRNVRDGKVTGVPPKQEWPYDVMFGIHRFGELREIDRRRLIISSANIETDLEKVSKTLTKAGVREEIRNQVVPLVQASFDEASDAALEIAREWKAEWRGITREQWGSEKAEGWEPEAGPQYALDDLPAKEEHLARLSREEGDLQEKLATVRAQASRYDEYQAVKARMSPEAITKLTSALKDTSIELKQAEEDLAEAQQALSKARQAAELKQALTCPHCDNKVAYSIDQRALTKVNEDAGDVAGGIDDRIEAQAIAEKSLKKLAALQERKDGLTRDLARAEAAAETLADMEKKGIPDAPPEDEVKRRNAELADVQAAKRRIEGEVNEARSAQALEKVNRQRVSDAADIHAKVMEGLKAAEMLGPSGIPLKMAEKALRKVNELLAAYSGYCEWPLISVGDDMAVRYGGRAYNLCSESQRWMMDSMIAIALSITCGARFVVLDRCDVLLAHDRNKVFRLAMSLVEPPASSSPAQSANRMDQIFLMASTPKRPNMPAAIQMIWRGD